jgi:hypothetical protein
VESKFMNVEESSKAFDAIAALKGWKFIEAE